VKVRAARRWTSRERGLTCGSLVGSQSPPLGSLGQGPELIDGELEQDDKQCNQAGDGPCDPVTVDLVLDSVAS